MAAKHSLAQQVLDLVDKIDEIVTPIRLEMAERWPASTLSLIMASAQLRTAAEIRMSASDYERTRRADSTSGSVMAQGGPSAQS